MCDGMKMKLLGFGTATAAVSAINSKECRNDIAEILLANQMSTMKPDSPKAVAHHTRVDVDSTSSPQAELTSPITGAEINPIVLRTIAYSHR